MKDAKGHGSDSRGGVSSQATAVKGLVNMIRRPAAHQEGIREGVPMSALPNAASLDAMVERLRAGVQPDYSNVPKMPAWIEWFGKAARRERRERRNAG